MTSTPYESLVVFGDSWSDFGILNQLFQGSFGAPIYNPAIFTLDRFGDAENYVDFLATDLGLETSDVQNFAIGGARAITDRTWAEMAAELIAPLPGGDADPNADFRVDLSAQVERFKATIEPGADLSDTAVLLNMGGNDLLRIDFALDPDIDLEARSAEYAQEWFDAILAAATEIAETGVGTLFICTEPDLTELPIAQDYPPQMITALELVAGNFNQMLRDSIDTFEALGVNVVLFDHAQMMQEIADDFATFGFRTYVDPISIGGQVPNPAVDGIPLDQIAHVDSVHTSTAHDRIVAQFQQESLNSNVVFGTVEADCLHGTKKDDLIVTKDGDDDVSLGRGDDVAIAGLGDDWVRGGRGDDLISGGSGNDWLKGGRGDDLIADGHGDDYSQGGRGDDIFIDGAGSDFASGGRGDDTFIFTDQVLMGGDSSSDANTFRGGRGVDTLVLRLEADDADAFNAGTLTLGDLGINTSSIEEVYAVAGLDLPADVAAQGLLEEADNWGFI
ncbi:MAG: SGNH/GDSL hydrolase family protein [Paracoccaceae bacterium]